MAAAAPTSGASVRLEVRVGGARPVVYEVGDGGFLIGAVPGCDLRLPGTGLPPVICLIARHAGGASLRKLAPVQPIGLNGQSVNSTYLNDGDRITVGPVELLVHLSVPASSPGTTAAPGATGEIEARLAQIEAERQRQVEQMQEWAERLQKQQAELDRRATAPREADHEEQAARLQKRKDRLAARHHVLLRAIRRIKERQQEVETRATELEAAEAQAASRQQELDARRDQLDRERQLLDEQIVALARRQQELQGESKERTADLETRERALAADRAALEQSQNQYKEDLLRLDRLQATTDQRHQQMQQRALEIDRRSEQLQRDTRELEEQAAHLDEWHTRLTAEQQAFDARRQDHQTISGQLDQRAATLEGQQAMLATLRTRMERIREELRREEQALSEQRMAQETAEADLRDRQEEVARLRTDLLDDRRLFDEERRRFEERRGTLEQAVSQLRQAQAALVGEQQASQQRHDELEVTAAEQADQAQVLLARGEQVQQLNQRLQAERQALQDREGTLTRAEQTLATLQEQLRRRFEDLDAREARLGERQRQLDARQQQYDQQFGDAERRNEEAARELQALRQELQEQAAGITEQLTALQARQQAVEAAEREGVASRQAVAAERQRWQAERAVAVEQDRHLRDEVQQARTEAAALERTLPELEARAAAALERLGRGREHLREQLAAVHGFARQSRDDLEAAQRQVQAEAERVRGQELEVLAARDEHRLAFAAFRQQLLDWQVRVDEMRQSLQLGTTQLERRQAELEQQARQAADLSARLAEEAVELQRQKQQVAERRVEVDRHLIDMREWYRKKLREIARVDTPAGEPGEGDIVPLPPAPGGESITDPADRDPARAILSLADEVAPADRQLGELLATLELVDDDTLQALWAEARRQRRSLRQLLLAGGYLTLYQMALIEAGNLDALVLGPVRVIDRLPSSPREAVYRVYDPGRNQEALLRHLAESEMHDAVRPDEFRQRFAAAAGVQHGNVACVLEVLTIHERPAALIEWVSGMPATDWPPLVSAPGVWYRLMCQAALALQATHAAGLCHGRLDGGALVLTGQGTVKLLGIGEPHWLSAAADDDGESVAADLAALGRLAAEWAAVPATGKSKARPLPAELQAVLARLTGAAEPFAATQELIAALEQAGMTVPATSTAWDRLLRQVREQAAPEAVRQSA